MTHHDRAFLVKASVTVGSDEYQVQLVLSRPAEPVLDRDMDIIRDEIERLLPAWIRTKIEAGEP